MDYYEYVIASKDMKEIVVSVKMDYSLKSKPIDKAHPRFFFSDWGAQNVLDRASNKEGFIVKPVKMRNL